MLLNGVGFLQRLGICVTVRRSHGLLGGVLPSGHICLLHKVHNMITVVRLYNGHIAALTAAVKAPVAKGIHHLTGIYILVQAAVVGVVVRRIVLRQLGKSVLGLLAAVILS